MVEAPHSRPFLSPSGNGRIPRPAPLIGREREIQAVVAEATAGARLVTVLGPPGIGKTSLAIAAAERISGRFEGGEWFCDLSSATTEQALCLTVASLFDHDSASRLGLGSASANSSPEQVAELLHGSGPLLLVLDNFEQLCGSAAVVHHWLSAARDLVLLVTSRERLAVDGEHVIELSPLEFPAPGGLPDEALASDAVQLFLRRAREAGAPASQDLEAVVDVVRLLDGIPLAIELAAARTRLLSAPDLARRLGRGEDVLASTAKRSSRHRTLTAAIAWSWSLLDPDEQRALVTCSVFKTSFAVEAAEALLGDATAVDLIGALRDKSLLRLDESGRLSLYQSIAEFARKRLEERGVGAVRAVRLAHARYFAGLAREFVDARLLRNENPATNAVARARLERDNLVAALEHVSELPGERDTRVVFATALALSYAIPADEADKYLVSVLEEPGLDTNARAMALLARQTALAALGRHDEGLAAARQVTEMPEADPGLVCFAYVYAGIQLRSEGDIDRALSYHERARELLHGRRLPRLSAMNTACMGRLECDRPNLEAARELNAQATKMCDDIGDVWLSALGIANLAQLEQEMQSFARADELFARALERFATAHEAQYEGIYACRRGGLYLEWNRLELARECLETAQRHMARVNLPVQRAVLHASLALLEAESRDPAAARRELARARRFAERGATGVSGVMLELLFAASELREPSVHSATVARWRARHAVLLEGDGADARGARSNLDARFALRMLARALSTHEQRVHVLRVGPDAIWFALDDTAKIDLGRRGSLRRMLVALIEAHANRKAMDGPALSSAGWPNELILAEAAGTRVRVAVATLRKLGLRDVLLTRDDGYRLDPELRVERV